MEALMTNLDSCDTNGNCDAKEACDSSTDFMGYLPINDPMLLMDPWNTDNINNSMNTNVDSLSTCSSSVGSDGNTGNNSSSPPSPDSPSHLSDCLHNTSDSCNVTARSNRRNIHGKKLYTAELDVMCRICGDKASGLHYGVHSCEGCKGFFRRTLKKNLIYKACNLGKNCKVNSGSRNKCQYCRFQRCLTAGMSQTAVRYGRMPKKEREKLIVDKEELQNNTTERLLELRCLSDTIIASFKHIFLDSNILPTEKEQEDVLQSHLTEIKNSHYFHAENVFHLFQSIIVPIMQAAVAFAKKIPGFCTFSMNDQIILMKQGTLAVAVLLFYKHVGQTFVKLKGHGLEMYLSRKSIIDTYECQQLLQIPVIIADKIHRLQLTNTELALYVAVVLLADGCNIENSAQVDSIRTDILHAFQLELKHNHPKCGTIALGRVLMLMSDLRQFVEEFAVCCNQRLFDTTDNFSNTAPLLREIFCT